MTVVEDTYDPQEFYSAVQGLEAEPERGGRCTVCYRLRMRRPDCRTSFLLQILCHSTGHDEMCIRDSAQGGHTGHVHHDGAGVGGQTAVGHFAAQALFNEDQL